MGPNQTFRPSPRHSPYRTPLSPAVFSRNAKFIRLLGKQRPSQADRLRPHPRFTEQQGGGKMTCPLSVWTSDFCISVCSHVKCLSLSSVENIQGVCSQEHLELCLAHGKCSMRVMTVTTKPAPMLVTEAQRLTEAAPVLRSSPFHVQLSKPLSTESHAQLSKPAGLDWSWTAAHQTTWLALIIFMLFCASSIRSVHCLGGI